MLSFAHQLRTKLVHEQWCELRDRNAAKAYWGTGAKFSHHWTGGRGVEYSCPRLQTADTNLDNLVHVNRFLLRVWMENEADLRNKGEDAPFARRGQLGGAGNVMEKNCSRSPLFRQSVKLLHNKTMHFSAKDATQKAEKRINSYSAWKKGDLCRGFCCRQMFFCEFVVSAKCDDAAFLSWCFAKKSQNYFKLYQKKCGKRIKTYNVCKKKLILARRRERPSIIFARMEIIWSRRHKTLPNQFSKSNVKIHFLFYTNRKVMEKSTFSLLTTETRRWTGRACSS